MFVSEKVVFMELHKTGCTHIRKVLKEVVGGELVGKHNQIPASLLNERRTFLGSIRDPWEWYVSLWAYGCDNKGAVFNNVTRKRGFRGYGWRRNPGAALRVLLSSLSRDPGKWERSYKDVNDKGAFREWLYMIHDKEWRRDVREGYGNSTMNNIAGLLTYRYMKLFCCHRGELESIDTISTVEGMMEFEKRNCFIDQFIRNERLEYTLFKSLQDSGINVSKNSKARVRSLPRTNTSSRKLRTNFYYDEGTKGLISKREKLIVEKFGYVGPSLEDIIQAVPPS